MPHLAALLVVSASSLFAESRSGEDRRLEELSLERLMRVEVTTVVGSEQEHLHSPAALYVITDEDIRRSGHRTLDEALRLVPGMFVAEVNNWTTIAGARGLVGSILTANRMLVLVDGRVVYDPLLNVTLWDAVDVVIEDVERIEVIRGPGPTLWGVNALNGVVNVITRSAGETTGLLAVAGGGDPLEAFATVRYGQQLRRTAYRVWAKVSDEDSLETSSGVDLRDELTRLRGGFRLDGGEVGGRTWTLQGNAYTHPTHRILARQPVPGQHLQFEEVVADDEVDGGHLRFRLDRGRGEREGWQLQTYQLHGALYHVDRLPQPDIDSYQRLDLGVTWTLRDDLELALWGRNLIDPHVESGAAEIPRGGYAMVRIDL
ncbi:MAG TPA: TonB-dependent receptor plug domain-containing protein [Thermoanaerobaculia bacterium]|nr:TonB-dependent receptor plug domain-containing protein [Thermoanaerobaculia bacterium]